MSASVPNQEEETPSRKRDETSAFILLTVFLAPLLSVIIVGGYGLLVWIHHMIFGPPTS